MGRRPWAELRGQIYLGSEVFIQRLTKNAENIQEVPRAQWQAVRPSLAEVFRQRGEQGIAVAYRGHGYRMREIAAYLGVHYATVSRRLRDLEIETKRDV